RYGWRGAVIGAAAAAAAVMLGPSRMGALGAGDDSAAGRIAAWGAGLRMLAGHPLLGVGMGRFTDFNDVNDLTAHNSFVLAFSELGLLGAICWVGMFSGALRAVWRSAIARCPGNRRTLSSPLAAALVASLCGYLVAAMFLSKTYFEIPFIYLGFAAAIAASRPVPGAAGIRVTAPGAAGRDGARATSLAGE